MTPLRIRAEDLWPGDVYRYPVAQVSFRVPMSGGKIGSEFPDDEVELLAVSRQWPPRDRCAAVDCRRKSRAK